VGFHKVLGITIRRQPDKGVALLMLYKVGINTQQHFGITDTGRLHHIHLTRPRDLTQQPRYSSSSAAALFMALMISRFRKSDI
jgi:hypothetical protein